MRYAQLVILVLAVIVGTPFLGSAQGRDGDRDCQTYSDPNRDPQSNSDAYQKGVQAGRSDAQHNRRQNPRSEKGQSDVDRRDYEAGYRRGYSIIKTITGQQEYGQDGNGGYSLHQRGSGSLGIQQNNSIIWQSLGTANACVYFKVDNGPERLFAMRPSGTQGAPWISQGHLYVFILRDIRGAELARDQIDLRSPTASNRLGSGIDVVEYASLESLLVRLLTGMRRTRLRALGTCHAHQPHTFDVGPDRRIWSLRMEDVHAVVKDLAD